MIHAHTLGRALQYYASKVALQSGKTSLTFQELNARVANIAGILSAQGFEPGDRLALLLQNDTTYLEIVYACAWLGVIAVPMNTRFSLAEIDRVLADSAPRGLIRHSSFTRPSVPMPWERVVDLEPLEGNASSAPDPICDSEAVLVLIYTSGTTGAPKGVILTHAAILANSEHVNYWMPHSDGVYLHAAPLFHIADFPFMFAAPPLGVCQVAIPRFSPASFCEAVQRYRVSHTVLVPTMINLLTQFADLGRYDLSSLRQLAYGGSPIAPEVIQRTREVFPKLQLMQVYGLSETGFLTALQDDEHTASRLLSCGRPCPGVGVQVMDGDGYEVAAGRTGEIVARGPNVMRGYWKKPEETARAFRDGALLTGDVGYLDADGYVFILDRLKDMIVTGGENVYSGEVEAALYQHPAVREAAVLGIPDAKWGEIVMACVVLKPGCALSEAELIAHCKVLLGSYKIPRRIEFSACELPKTGSGKILKRALRERYWAGQQRAVS